MPTSVIQNPSVKESIADPTTEGVWRTVLYNCDCHTFDEVIRLLVKAIGCSAATASQFAETAQTLDHVTVYRGPRAECGKVAAVLGSTGLRVRVRQGERDSD